LIRVRERRVKIASNWVKSQNGEVHLVLEEYLLDESAENARDFDET
jgi:hypothetical protein